MRQVYLIRFLSRFVFLTFVVLLWNNTSFSSGIKTELAQKIIPAVVVVKAFGERGVQQGTGFFVDKKGIIITNNHVIESSRTIQVELSDGSIYRAERILAYSETKDLAKLQIKSTKSDFPFLKLANQRVNVGEEIMVIGSPLGLESTVTDGIVSSIRNLAGFGNVIQISAPISAGSSGSPVIDLDGTVIGVATFTTVKGHNLNFAIPSNYVIGLKEDKSTLPSISMVANPWTNKINYDVQLKDNGFIKILSKGIIINEIVKIKDRDIEWRKLKVEVQALKPCVPTDMRERCKGEWEMAIDNMASGDKELSVSPDCEGKAFYVDLLDDEYRCDYRFKVFSTYFDEEGNEMYTYSSFIKEERRGNVSPQPIYPGEKRTLYLTIPGDLPGKKMKYWYVWVPR